jgi:alkylated DNA repair dioxygenase AlkB
MRSETLQLPLDGLEGGTDRLVLGSHAQVLPGHARDGAAVLLAAIDQVAAVSPFRRMLTPGGWEMSVAMTNCGSLGWVTDRGGYRYDAVDPLTTRPWPAMPEAFFTFAAEAAAAAHGASGSITATSWSGADRIAWPSTAWPRWATARTRRRAAPATTSPSARRADDRAGRAP